jgi:hypothetical protein
MNSSFGCFFFKVNGRFLFQKCPFACGDINAAIPWTPHLAFFQQRAADEA